MVSPTQTPDLTPIVRGLLDSLEGTLNQAKANRGLVAEIYRVCRDEMLPAGELPRLSYGLTYKAWAERLTSKRHTYTEEGIRNAFWRIGDALPKVETGRAISLPLKSGGKRFQGVLTLVPPAVGGAPAGFEISGTVNGNNFSSSLSRVAEQKRTRRETKPEIEAAQIARSLQRAAKGGIIPGSLVEEYFEAPAAPRKLRLVSEGGVAFYLVRASVVIAFVLLGSALAAAASPQFREWVVEVVTSFFGRSVQEPSLPPPTPVPLPTAVPLPTPPPARGHIRTSLVAVTLPGPASELGRVVPLNRNDAGDLAEEGDLTATMGLSPWIHVAQTSECPSCILVLAYPAVRESRPLRHQIDFGDGTPAEIFDSRSAHPTGPIASGISGLSFVDDPEWREVYALTAKHTLPAGVVTTRIAVAVFRLEPDGSETPLVTLVRKVRLRFPNAVTAPTPASDPR